MAPDVDGVWGTALTDVAGKQYWFEADGVLIADPYAWLTRGDYGPAVFPTKTDHAPKNRPSFAMGHFQKRGIYELHVKDMSARAAVPGHLKGKYAALREPAIREHLDYLGVGAVELLPVAQFDKSSGWAPKHPQGLDINHWGYMPTFHGAVHDGYALDPATADREMTALVEAEHESGRAVILDVVYNHMANGEHLNLRLLGQDYYFRMTPNGKHFENGAGTGNELATNRPMVRRLMIQLLRRFAVHYGVDGFRFDLGALLRPQELWAVKRALPKRSRFLTAEPWGYDWNRSHWGKGSMNGWGPVWNDDYRNNAQQFIVGEGDRTKMMTGIAGSIAPLGHGNSPLDTVNMIESHDEHTVADMVKGDRHRAMLAMTMLLTSQGVPMIAQGQELMRSKKGLKDTFNRDDDVNHVDYDPSKGRGGFLRATRELLRIRRESPHFHYNRALTDDDISWLLPADNHAAVGYRVRAPKGTQGRKAIPDLLVVLNPHTHLDAHFALSATGTTWEVLFDGWLDRDGVQTGSVGDILRVPPGVSFILREKK